jgi:2',3'-cyclic-nucleotide 2'-phosphodiesterase (5'-nucleotidase family)
MNISIYNLIAFFASFGVLAVVVVNAETKLTIIHVNDHHSHLSEDTGGYVDIFDNDIPSEISSKNGDTTNVRAYFGGYPRIVTAFQEL